MTDMPLYEYLLQQIKGKFKPGDSFTESDVEADRSTKHSRQNALWILYKKGYLDKPRGRGTRGRYILRSRKTSTPLNADSVKKKVAKRRKPVVTRGKRTGDDPDMVVIERLLTAMANAEPVIKKWSKVHEALKGI